MHFNLTMKALIPLFIFLFSILNLIAQSVIFEKPFGNNHRIRISDVAEKPQSGYILCGFTTDTFPSRGYIASLDTLGNLEWENEYFIPDSDFHIDHILALDSNSFVLQCLASKPGGYYEVPRLLKMDSSGTIRDTFWVDISGVYNTTSNRNLFPGANKTFWALTFIGTTGISNELTLVRHDENMDTLKCLKFGNYYYQQFCSNRN